jgi:hypothetical protein
VERESLLEESLAEICGGALGILLDQRLVQLRAALILGLLGELLLKELTRQL